LSCLPLVFCHFELATLVFIYARSCSVHSLLV
jgi:hypothetical protein